MYELTPILLNLYQDCIRCFWSEVHENIKKPGSKSKLSLKGGMYLLFKNYTDVYREKGVLPVELKDQIDGVLLPDHELVKKWRDPKTCLSFKDESLGVHFTGYFDDCVLRTDDRGEKTYIPLDFKVRGIDTQEEQHDNHAQMKLDCYDLLLKKNNYPTANTGYLVYYVPDEVKELGVVKFNVQVIQFVTEADRAMNFIREVVRVLNGEIPAAGTDCEYCSWGDLAEQMSGGKI